jgi:hypothetical protein
MEGEREWGVKGGMGGGGEGGRGSLCGFTGEQPAINSDLCPFNATLFLRTPSLSV